METSSLSLPVRASRVPDRISTAANLGGLSFKSHYVYRIAAGKKFYLGVRSCYGDPKNDSYMGSATADMGRKPRKKILSIHETRDLAEQEETRLINAAIGTPGCLNRKRSNWWKFRFVNSVNS